MSDHILHLSSSHSPVFLLNSRLGRFSAALSIIKRLFSRSYETILPSSLATNHSSTLGYSPRLPVSVYGTGYIYLKLRGFSWKYAWAHYQRSRRIAVLSYLSSSADLPTESTPSYFNLVFRLQAVLTRLRHPIAVYIGTGILTRLPSVSPFGYALGPD